MPDPIADSLLEYRAKFPALEQCVHFISHSLGCVPAQAATDLAEFAEQWRTKSITAWSDWLPEVDRAAERICKLISAPKGTVVMQQNVSGIMATLASCLDYTAPRNRVVYEALQFPTVSYVWQAEARRGAECVLVPSADGTTIDTAAMLAAIDERTLVVPISHVVFSSAYIQDVKAICDRARAVGAHVILDCYQSIGTLPIDVVDLGVSFACGGSVKYLCGGPGAAWLYVREDLIPKFSPRVTGWFGNEAPFAFTMPAQSYADNIWRFMGGTPAVAALYQARAGHTIVGEIGARKIRDKSLVMTQKCIDWIDELGMKLNSPRPAERRGGSVVFDFVGSADVCRELNRRKFFCDHRPQAGIRIAPHFYTKPEEVDLFFGEVKKIRGGTGALMARRHHPNFVRGAAGLGAARLREVAKKAGVDAPASASADELSAALLRGLDDANEMWSLIESDDLEPIGVALGLGARARWRSKLSPAEFEALPFYRKPSYDQDVLDMLLASGPPPEPKPRAGKKRKLSKAWPELATLAAWTKASKSERAAVARRLAKALPAFAAGKPALAGPHELPRLRHKKLGVDFVVVPGGKLAMGLSAAEQRDLAKVAKAAGDEAVSGAKDIAAQARPAHDVKVAAFAVAVHPLTRAQVSALGAEVVDELPGDAARATGPDAARAIAAAAAPLRLPSEAEWEWLARAGGARAWLSGDRTAAEWAELHARGESDDHPFAVDGLGWGEWIDDGWHATYRGAPATSAAWQPAEWPTVARGGALALWPWQTGELVMCHAAARSRDAGGQHCVRLAVDLP